MPYPESIQPNANFKSIEVDLSDYFLIRHTNINDLAQLVNPDNGEVVLIHICDPTKRMDDLSTSLLGVFDIAHTQIEILENRAEYFLQYCNPDDVVDIPVDETDYNLNLNRHYFVIPIGKIIGQQVRYTKADDELEASCCIVHSPMRWNFWHYSIRWKAGEVFIHTVNNDTWKKRLCSNARAFIAKFAKVTEPNFSELPKAAYQKVVAA